MPLPVYRLRRILALTAVLFTALVGGMYFYARLKTRDVRKTVGSKLGIEIKQTANGFQFSKSDGKRTLFTVQAGSVKEFKLNGRADLHNVNIVVYGRDSSRFDQIYGDDFSYDPSTGDVTGKGEVQIDLVANPAGLAAPDQSAPKELKNPIHLKTRDLVFNRETGNAWTDAKVEFRTLQATGSAMGAKYIGKSNLLTLSSVVHVVLSAPHAAVIDAERGEVTRDPREIVLEHPRLEREAGTMLADRAVFYLGSDNSVERVVATGNVSTDTRVVRRAADEPAQADNQTQQAATSAPQTNAEILGRADEGEFLLSGKGNRLHTASLTGNVHFEQLGAQPMQGDAGRVIMDFTGKNELQTVHAMEGAHLAQKATTQKGTVGKTDASDSGPQDFELTAPEIDFTVAQGRVLERAVTSGAARITITPSADAAGPRTTPAQKTVVTAGTFDAAFTAAGGRNHLTSIHGAPDARVVSSAAGAPDRVSTSDAIDAAFLPQGGIESVTQRGHVAYTDDQPADKRMQAWAATAHYTPADQMLVLSGSPRVINGSTATTAKTIRINRATGEAVADGDVKTTYSDLKEQPDGALLASSSPIHVTARTMSVQNGPGSALYSGNARLWQDANVIEAPSIQFDRDRRFVTAQGTAEQPVETILVQREKVQTEKVQTEKVQTPRDSAAGTGSQPKVPEKNPPKTAGKASLMTGSTPVSITAAKLTYADAERKIHYEGNVIAKGTDFTATAKTADAYLQPRSQNSANQSVAGPGQLDHMVAEGDVLIQEPNRRAAGQKLVYTAADDKFFLTGGPPSIFDAEQGKITGVSLTFFRRDDRVLVEGEASSPVVTTTRVAR